MSAKRAKDTGMADFTVRTMLAGALAAVLAHGVAPFARAAPFADALAPRSPDQLALLNGDRLSGELLGLEAGDFGLAWRHVASDGTVHFAGRAVAAIRLGSRAPSGDAPSTNSASVVYLTNGDELCGRLIALGADALTLDTACSGKVRILRTMVRRIDPAIAGGEVIFEGPTGLADWSFQTLNRKPTWRYRDGALHAAHMYPIGRTIAAWPERFLIEFDAAWRSFPSLQVAFMADSIAQSTGARYVLQFSGVTCYLFAYKADGSMVNLGSANMQEPSQEIGTSMRIRIAMDQPEKTIALVVDEQLVKRWSVPGHSDAMKGRGIQFLPQNQGDLKLARIRVARWNGRLSPDDEKLEQGDEDMIRFINGDAITGGLESIKDGAIAFRSTYATLNIPVERAEEIHLSPAHQERARRRRGDVRAVLTGRGAVTLDAVSIVSNVLSGTSGNCGNLSIPLGALKALEFNIYRDRTDDAGASDE